jgi:hypothetical protein
VLFATSVKVQVNGLAWSAERRAKFRVLPGKLKLVPKAPVKSTGPKPLFPPAPPHLIVKFETVSAGVLSVKRVVLVETVMVEF